MTDAAGGRADAEAGTVEPGLRVPFSADGARGPRRVRRRLVKLIAAKLVVDLLFVCSLAFYTHAVTYRTGFDGGLERADGLEVRGWVVDLERPGAPVELQLFLDGHFAAATVSDEPSPGTTEEPASNGRRAFVFRFEQPRYGEHEVRVYAVRQGRAGARRTLQQISNTRGFIHK